MRSYRNAKARLFRVPSLKCAVLNLDDRFGVDLVAPTQRRGVSVLGYGFNRTAPAGLRGRRVPRLVGRNLRMGPQGLAFEVATPWGRSAIESRLVGRFNAANLLGTLAVLLASDVRLEESIAALEKVGPVPGAPSATAAAGGLSSSSITRIRRTRLRTCCARCASS